MLRVSNSLGLIDCFLITDENLLLSSYIINLEIFMICTSHAYVGAARGKVAGDAIIYVA